MENITILTYFENNFNLSWIEMGHYKYDQAIKN